MIPAKNAAAFLGPCLDAARPLLARGELAEIVVVDDGSTDQTLSVLAAYPVRIIRSEGRGRGAARNLGWRAAQTPLVWFIDADCVAEPEALARLVPHLEDPAVAAAGGSYGNMRPGSLLACLIQEEIACRHARMLAEVDFLATFNVLFRRRVLDELGGFDERYLRAQDAELAYRVRAAGHKMAFELGSRVGHFHEDRLRRYLAAQKEQGYWRVWLYFDHPGRAGGDAYSGWVDHLQPPLAAAAAGLLPGLLVPPLLPWAAAGLAATLLALLLLQAPMTAALVRRTGSPRYLAFAPLGWLRAFWRGWGMSRATLAALTSRRAGRGERVRMPRA